MTIPDCDGSWESFQTMVRAVFPGCEIDEDDDGEIVIYTRACVCMGGTVEYMGDE